MARTGKRTASLCLTTIALVMIAAGVVALVPGGKTPAGASPRAQISPLSLPSPTVSVPLPLPTLTTSSPKPPKPSPIISTTAPAPGGGGGSGSGGSGGSGSGGSSGSGGGSTGGGHSSAAGGGGGGISASVIQAGFAHNFGALSGQLFTYNGPFHFKPPFRVGNVPGTVVGGSGVEVGGLFGPSSRSPGHAVSTKGRSSGGGAPAPQPSTANGVNVALASNDAPGHDSAWLLIPVGLLLLAAAAVIVFQKDEDELSVGGVSSTTSQT